MTTSPVALQQVLRCSPRRRLVVAKERASVYSAPASHAATAPCSHPVPRPFVAIGRLLNSRANVVLCDFVWRNRWPLGVTFAVTMWIAAFHFNPRKYESTDAGMLQSVEEQLAARDEHDEQVAAAERIAELAAHR